MSTFARVLTQITDLNLLKKSLDSLEMPYELGAKNVPFYGTQNQDLDIHVPKYHLGFVANSKNGSYDLVGDIDHEKIFSKIKVKYAELKVTQAYENEGYVIEERKVLENGKLQLKVKRSAWA